MTNVNMFAAIKGRYPGTRFINWNQKAWFGPFYRKMFALGEESLKVFDSMMQHWNHDHFSCVQIRMENNAWPQIVEGGDDSYRNRKEHLSVLWEAISKNKDRTFITSDNLSTLFLAESLFPGKVMFLAKPVVHIDIGHSNPRTKEDWYQEGGRRFRANDAEDVFATFHFFQFCKEFIFSRSGFGEMGAALMKLDSCSRLQLWKDGALWPVSPCEFVSSYDGHKWK
mmetsp:Transcript_2110/g.6436  ORF Transcript_2110/g.6436 Transcript_2110/m.6436 type:complete len:225 (+) Transcript_2110:1180-1854(+)